MALEQYIVRELKQDIKLLISKVIELEHKLEKMENQLKIIKKPNKMDGSYEEN